MRLKLPLNPALLHPLLESSATGRRVLDNSHLTQGPIHPQPGRASGAGFQVFVKTAPKEGAERLLRIQHLGLHRIQVDLLTHDPEITVATAMTTRLNNRPLCGATVPTPLCRM